MVILRTMAEREIDAFILDPPYGLAFMGKEWDDLGKTFVERKPVRSTKFDMIGGNHNPTNPQDSVRTKRVENQRTQAWHEEWLREAFRILPPGGVVKAFSGTRTYHRLAAAMEAVGLILDPSESLEAWAYGSGFPKSLDISKAIDKQDGADEALNQAIQTYLRESREARGLSKADVDKAVFGGTTRYSWVEGRGGQRFNEVYLPTPEEWVELKLYLGLDDRFDAYIEAVIPSREDRFRADGGKANLIGVEEGDWGFQSDGERWGGKRRITAPAAEDAKRFSGWGTALKPAWEPILVGRKP